MEIRHIDHKFEDYSLQSSDLNIMKKSLSQLFIESLKEFTKNVDSKSPINICSVKEKSYLDHEIYEGKFIVIQNSQLIWVYRKGIIF